MFGKRKQDEVVVRGLDEKYIDRMKAYHKQKAGINATLTMIMDKLSMLEAERQDIWDEIYEEYALSDKDTYSMNIESAEISRCAK